MDESGQETGGRSIRQRIKNGLSLTPKSTQPTNVRSNASIAVSSEKPPRVSPGPPLPSETPSPKAPEWVQKQSQSILGAKRRQQAKELASAAPIPKTPSPEYAHFYEPPAADQTGGTQPKAEVEHLRPGEVSAQQQTKLAESVNRFATSVAQEKKAA